jgi:hypothetical protein
MCAKSDYLLVTLHTEGEGINLNNYLVTTKRILKTTATTTTMKTKTTTMTKWAIDLPLLLELLVLAVLPVQDAPQQGL